MKQICENKPLDIDAITSELSDEMLRVEYGVPIGTFLKV